MALAISILERGSFGNMNAVIGAVAFDSSYPTGGEALTANQLGLAAVKFIIFEPTAGLVFEYDHTNSKLLAYRQTDPGAVGGADIALAEVGDTANLAAVVGVNFLAVGF